MGSILSPRLFHTPLDFLKDIFYFCSKSSHLSMRMIFMDFIWTFTFYSKMYKLFRISWALERNEELIKRWKCGQLRYFRSDSRQGIGQNIWRFLRNRYFKVLAFLLSLIFSCSVLFDIKFVSLTTEHTLQAYTEYSV